MLAVFKDLDKWNGQKFNRLFVKHESDRDPMTLYDGEPGQRVYWFKFAYIPRYIPLITKRVK